MHQIGEGVETVELDIVRRVLTAALIGEGVHTALRKYCDDGMEAHRAITRMPAAEWHRAMGGVAADLIAYIEREATESADESTGR